MLLREDHFGPYEIVLEKTDKYFQNQYDQNISFQVVSTDTATAQMQSPYKSCLQIFHSSLNTHVDLKCSNSVINGSKIGL